MKSFRQNSLALLVMAALLTPRACKGQSTYYFNNFLPDAPVFDASGNRLSGTNYVAVLYGGTSPVTLQLGLAQGLVTMSPVPFTVMHNGLAGYFRYGGFVEVSSINPGGLAWLQVRAWDARLGASYGDVAKQGLGGYGESNLFEAPGGDPTLTEPGIPGPLTGLQSFSLLPEVPEPRSLLLLSLWLPLFLARRRRRE